MAPALSEAAPGLCAILGGLVALFLTRQLRPLTATAWTLWAALAGGLAVDEVMSLELLNKGAVGLIMVGVAGCLTGVATTAGLRASQGRFSPVAAGSAPDDRRTVPVAAGAPDLGAELGRRALRAGTPLGVATAASLALVALDLPMLAAAGLVVTGSVVLAARPGWTLSLGLVVSTSLIGAAEVVLGRVVLSPLGLVGHPLPTILVALLATSPLICLAGRRSIWSGAAARGGAMDAAALAVGIGASAAWLHLFRGMSDFQTMSQLSQLGEDNNAHLLMLQATQYADTALGASESSRAVTSNFSGYFPGPSLWQSALGAVLPDMSVVHLYVVSTAVLLGLLAGSVTAVASLAVPRAATFAAVAAVCVGAVGTRLLLAQYEFGFPGQLLTAIWLMTALAAALLEAERRAGRLLLVVTLTALALAAWWTWSLAAPLYLLPVASIVVATVLRRTRGRFRASLVVVAAGTGAVGAIVLRHRVRSALDLLNIDGPVFRAVPMWFALILLVLLPIAVLAAGKTLTPAVTSLCLGTGVATVTLTAWQLGRLGHLTYYSYKLQYLLLAIGWAATVLLLASLVARRERTLPRAVRIGGGLLLALACVPVGLSASRAYESWLAERGVLTANPALTCAAAAAAAAPTDSIALAVGFGSPTVDYLTTKSMINASVSDASIPFWNPMFNGAAPETWPWTADEPYVVVRGPAAVSSQTDAVVRAGIAAGAEVVLGPLCGVK